MANREGMRLAELSRAVRESTLKRLRKVPAGAENWRAVPGAMSVAEHARHLIVCDEWLFAALDRGFPDEAVDGETRPDEAVGPEQFQELFAELERCGRERAARLEGLSDKRLDESVRDPRFGEVALWWSIARGSLDHEAHHRGTLAAYLQAIQAGKRL